VAYKALADYLETHPNDKGIFLETAHPVKFYDVVEPITNQEVEVPAGIKEQMLKEKKSISIGNAFEELKKFLLKN
jgi:threonine synthase